MKIKHNIFLYFLFFIICSHCDLIPNNKVITDTNSEEFNLVEGITYTIAHLKSGLNLDSNGEKVYVSHSSSPYQYWSLRKANGSQYNIISAESGINLDSDGERTYISNPEDNSISNPYQQWMFTKIKNNIFNIAHVKSRNLDSDGVDVYVSLPEHNSKNNLYQQWLFEPSKYKVTAEVTHFEYPPDLKDKINQYKSRTSLLSGNYLIENNANVTIEQTIDKTETKINSYTMEIKKSDSLVTTKNIAMAYRMGGTIFGILGINTGFTSGIKREIRSVFEKVYKESITETVSYHVTQKIIVPPFNSVIVNSTVDKISIKAVPFKAKIRITGKADRLDENGEVVSMTNVEANALRCYLQNENFDIKNITVEGNSLIIDTVGTLNVDGYGLETNIETIQIPHKDPNDPNKKPEEKIPDVPNNPIPDIPKKPKETKPEYPKDPKDPEDIVVPEDPKLPVLAVLFYFSIIASFIPFTVYYIVKLYLNHNNRYHYRRI